MWQTVGFQPGCLKQKTKKHRLLASSVADGGIPASVKDYKIGICCFSTKHAPLKNKSKDWLAWNQDNVSKWADVSTHGMLLLSE